MRVLHYSLGFPPSRTGGLTYYSLDLIQEQIKQGIEIVYLYPGRYNWFSKKVKIAINQKKSKENLAVYQLHNSLPLPLFGGIKTPEDFMFRIDETVYLKFLKQIKPEAIHVHTLMGVHKEFFEAAKTLNIPLFFTTHDYFGLAPEPNFYHQGELYNSIDKNTAEKWVEISQNALSTRKLRLFQSSFYPALRKIASKIKSTDSNPKKNIIQVEQDNAKIKSFSTLKEYYHEVFSMIDYFLFNSTTTQKVYEENLLFQLKGEVISVTNSKIKLHINHVKIPSEKIRIAYIGPNQEFKGFTDFITLSTLLDASQFELHTYGYSPINEIDNIQQHGKYAPHELERIYENIDVLIVPSKWKETFGLIVLEALSYNTIVYVSENVGAKDLVDASHIFNSVQSLASRLEAGIYPNESITLPTIEEHSKKIIDIYKKTYV